MFGFNKEALLQKKGWWKRRTGLEKVLMSLIGVCAATLLVSGIVVFNGSSPQEEQYSRDIRQDDVCLTPECAVAGNVLK